MMKKMLVGLALLLGSLAVSAESATISLDPSGGLGAPYGKRVKSVPALVRLPACRYTRPGYRFVGWSGKCQDCYYLPGEQVLVTGDTTYTANWEEYWIDHATNYCAYVRNEAGEIDAVLLAKVGRPNAKKGISKVSVTVYPATGKKKLTFKGYTDDKGACTITVKGETLDVLFTESSVTGTSCGMDVYGAPVNPAWGAPKKVESGLGKPAPPIDINYVPSTGPVATTTTYLTCLFTTLNVSDEPIDGCWLYMPQDVPVVVDGRRWSTPRKTPLKIRDGEPDVCTPGNPWGLKLSYNNSKGLFTGGFMSYQNTTPGVMMVSVDHYSVVGVVVDGVGYGYAVTRSGKRCDVSVVEDGASEL